MSIDRTFRDLKEEVALDQLSTLAQQISFEELIALLNEEANKIVLEMGGEIRLMAKGLDLRPRLPTEKAARHKTKVA